MADQQQKLGIVVYVEDQASGKLTKVKAEVAGIGPAGAVAGRGLATGASSIEKSAGRIGGALSHAKGAIGGLLTGPLGILGLGAGLFSLGTFLDSGLHKASDFAVQIEKLTGLTGESAQSMGALLLLTDKYGISAERTGMIVGFAEKTLGMLNDRTGKAAQAEKSAALQTLEAEKLRLQAAGASTARVNKLISEQKALDALRIHSTGTITALATLEHQYGVSLHDSSGHVVNFSTELSRLSDYYTSNATASDKAALTAKLLGRGYADMIPILMLGSKGIRDQEQAYKDLGLQLGTNTQDTLKAYQSSIRQVGEAVNILQLQLGLALAPMITKAANAFSLFLEHGGAKQIVGVFEQGANFAEALGSAIGTYVIPAFGAIKAGWDSIPAPLRTMLLAGEIGGKAFKFLFGVDISPTHLAGDIAKGLAGGLERGFANALGKTAIGGLAQTLLGGVQKVWVVNPGFGAAGGAGNLAEGAVAAAAGSTIGLLAATIIPIVAGMALGYLISQDPQVTKVRTETQPIGGTVSAARGGLGLANLLNDPRRPGQSPIEDHFQGVIHGLGMVAGNLGSEERATNRLASALDHTASKFDKPAWLKHWEDTMGRTPKALAEAMHAAFLAARGGTATVRQVNLLGANAGRGSAVSTRNEIGALTTLAATTHDPALQAAITRALGELKASLPKHDQVAAAYAQAEKIVASSESTAEKLKDLGKIKADMAKVSPTVAAKVGELITAVRTHKTNITVAPSLKDYITAHVKVDAEWTVAGNTSRSSSYATSAASTDTRFAGYTRGLASGATGIARSPTAAIFGEAGAEGVAIIRNPRPFTGHEALGGGGAPITLHVNPVTNVHVSARDVDSAITRRNRYASGRLLQRLSYAPGTA
ncbi:MAG TPA: hypothetical protein VIL81_09315 [Candidatus Limnocylindrales bacterium]|jgi:hypothetical protein